MSVDNGESIRPEMGRRDFLQKALIAGSILVLSGCTIDAGEQAQLPQRPDGPSQDADTTPESKQTNTDMPPLFENPQAAETANELGINAGNMWMTDKAVMQKITENNKPEPGKNGLFRQDKILPIFPAALYEYRDVMEQVSEEMEVPINVVATIASIESAGVTTARSSVANGLFQVVPGFHLDKIVRVAREAGKPLADEEALLSKWEAAKSRTSDPQALNKVVGEDVANILEDPYIGCKVGMMILKDFHLSVVQKAKVDPDGPIAWARALAAYNGGGKNAWQNYEKMPTESQLYAVHAIRYFMVGEIAAQLRNKGMPDEEIARAVASDEMNARVSAYQKTGVASIGSQAGIKQYEKVWKLLATPTLESDDPAVKDLAEGLRHDYDNYKSKVTPSYDVPVSAALRMWIAHGGYGLFSKSAINMNPDNYTNAHPNE